MKKLIYIVEDEESLQRLYAVILRDSDYIVEIFDTAESMFESLENQLCDLIIMDYMLPGMDGIEAIQKLRTNRKFSEIPCIIVSAKGEEESKVNGLESGADDYISKPFSNSELKARIRANLRKNSLKYISEKEIYYDQDSNGLYVKGQKLDLTATERKLLMYFINNPNRIITRDELFNELWDKTYQGSTRTLDMHVSKLRNIIAQYTNEEHIRTARGEGYKYTN